MDTSDDEPDSPEEQQRLAELDADIQRHRVMKGHPPTGPLFPKGSKEETARLLSRLRFLSRGMAEKFFKDGTFW
jgi:hypothetical protein